ncbi:peptidoglycan D,D-transpeptidase FtsI family protein [Jiella sonneratiae]|uniref:Penicillin-binding protein 2 n=1 Tax=Jiella sonneratiae TaxID=2816856 RepID=A0ABS3J7T1_9HYPH|nr:penicillin-binding protein 2 [Jiella sonneratiae]MBO0905724.1 penicillin-binding protein 2 [Jiella sonneratiae]
MKFLSIATARIVGRSKRTERPHPQHHRSRTFLTSIIFFSVFSTILGRLVWFGVTGQNGIDGMFTSSLPVSDRPDIVDRNGQILATDLKTASLYAEPRRIVDADEATEAVLTVLPDLDAGVLYKKLNSKAGFAWLSRGLTPTQQQAIFNLGIPGIGFRTERRRFYPGGAEAAHVLGLTNIDNHGISGMEKYLDDSGFRALQATGLASQDGLSAFKLSIDRNVQHVVHQELVRAMQEYRAIAAGGVVLDVDTGEIIAMASLPDYDLNEAGNAPLQKENLNRMSAGTFEMGSTFKIFTTAMALDFGVVSINSRVATTPFTVAGHTIREFHNEGSSLTVPEIFKYSSNVGSAREADMVGVERHQEFLTRLGLLSKMQTELPEVAMPTQPKSWKKINSMTIAFGHGVSTTPLNTAVAAAALINGGYYIPPTFLPRSVEEANAIRKQIARPTTSQDMRAIFKLNGEEGTGRQANVEGYHVGGKTGTAEKVEHGRYNHDKRFNAFVGAFPIDKPRYIVMSIIDEPKVEKGKPNAQAGWNAAPMVGNIVRGAATFLNVKPDFGEVGAGLMRGF